MLHADRMLKPAKALARMAFAVLLLVGPAAFGPAQATTMGPIRSNGSGEVFEPSALRPVAPAPARNDSIGEPPGLQSLPVPSIEVYEMLGAAIVRARSGPRERRDYNPSAEGFSGMHNNLTALDWIELWSEHGYWLENDQWSDFQAVALASYLPDLRYWLGRDRWSAFGAGGFGIGENNGFDGSSSTEKKGSGTHGVPTPGGYSTGPESFFFGDDSRAEPKPKSEPKTLSELLILMVIKISRQPLFYLGIAGVLLILTLALRRQSTQPIPMGFAKKTSRIRRVRRRKKAAPNGAA